MNTLNTHNGSETPYLSDFIILVLYYLHITKPLKVAVFKGFNRAKHLQIVSNFGI